jgi:hypothetical protein
MNTNFIKPVDNNEIDEIYNLLNISNYQEHISVSINEILSILMLLLKEYVTLIYKKGIKSKYIIYTGLNTLLHVFNIMFYYTKNLKLTCYYTQQAYHVYLDFINELNNVSISFLNLKTNDAVMFVYKKTIFEICNDRKKNIINNTLYNSFEDTDTFEILNKITSIYKIFIHHSIHKINNIFITETNVNIFCNCLTQLNTIICSKKKEKIVLELLCEFIILLMDNQYDAIYENSNSNTNNELDIACETFMFKIDYFLTTIYKKNHTDKPSITRIKNNILKLNDEFKLNYDLQTNEINKKLIDVIICGIYETIQE